MQGSLQGRLLLPGERGGSECCLVHTHGVMNTVVHEIGLGVFSAEYVLSLLRSEHISGDVGQGSAADYEAHVAETPC